MSKIRVCGVAALVACSALVASSGPAAAAEPKPPKQPAEVSWTRSTSPVGYLITSVENLIGFS